MTSSITMMGATNTANLRMLNRVIATKAVSASILWSSWVNIYTANVAKPTCKMKACEPHHEKNNKMACAPSKDFRSGWAATQSVQPSLSAWKNIGSLATHWVHCEDWSAGRMPATQWVHSEDWSAGRMSRLIWVFAGRTVVLCKSTYKSDSKASTNLYLSLTMWKPVYAICK